MILVSGATGNVGRELVRALVDRQVPVRALARGEGAPIEGRSAWSGTSTTLSARMPEAYVRAFFDFYVDGSLDESPVLPTVQEVTGRPPRTFADWAGAHADVFR